MGILNVTPDSFSGDGLATPDRGIDEVVASAVEQAVAFVAAGAEILDVGAESTRPRTAYGDRPPVDEATETALAIPVVRAVAEAVGDRALVSIDTSQGRRGARGAGRRRTHRERRLGRDPRSGHGRRRGRGRCAPRADAQPGGGRLPRGRLRRPSSAGSGRRSRRPWSAGSPRERIIVDPGIGFGKGTEENLELLRRLSELKDALGGLPMLIGTSRKRFLGELLDGAPPDDRVEATAATVALAIAAGADIVRVHDVAHIARTRRIADAIVRG